MNNICKKYKDWDVIVMGASTGGLKALEYLLSGLPTHFRLPIIIVQHISPSTDSYLAERFSQVSPLPVKEIDEQEVIQPSTVYVAPGGYHVLIEEDLSFSLCVSEKISYSRPSIDVLFKSAAEVFNGRVLAIILTGANSDGKIGALYIKQHGGTVIAQDPATAEAPTMPKAVIVAEAADYILSLEEIRQFILKQDMNYDCTK